MTKIWSKIGILISAEGGQSFYKPPRNFWFSPASVPPPLKVRGALHLGGGLLRPPTHAAPEVHMSPEPRRAPLQACPRRPRGPAASAPPPRPTPAPRCSHCAPPPRPPSWSPASWAGRPAPPARLASGSHAPLPDSGAILSHVGPPRLKTLIGTPDLSRHLETSWSTFFVFQSYATSPGFWGV